MSKDGKVHEDFCNSPPVDVENQVFFYTAVRFLSLDCTTPLLHTGVPSTLYLPMNNKRWMKDLIPMF